jgi:hypothetical protein
VNKKQREAVARGLRAVDIRPNNEDQFRRPTLKGGFDIFSRVGATEPSEVQNSALRPVNEDFPLTPDRQGEELTPDRQQKPLTSDRQKPLTLKGKRLPLTPSKRLPPTPIGKKSEELPPDRQSQVNFPPTPTIFLAPLQWRVLQVLQEIENNSEIYTYRDIAAWVGGKREGVKSAVEVLRKVGAVLDFKIVRTAKAQGVRFRLNREQHFMETSLEKSKGLSKRGSDFALTVGGRGEASSTSMYVEKTYIRELLGVLPDAWEIREQTLLQIWRLLPNMSRLEFRRSLLNLIEQAKSGPEIKNPNAWLRGAFERNGGPIVTEAMIEAQIERRPSSVHKAYDVDKDRADKERIAVELEVLHRYLVANAEEKEQIDNMAEERLGRLLITIAPDKHAGIREQARLECAREYFAAQAKAREGRDS